MNIKENIALGKSCVQDTTVKCIGSRCMAWRFRVEYPKSETKSISSMFQSMATAGVYNHEYGRCGLVDK